VENRALRKALCARGEYDGYLLYLDGAPAGWCQVGPRDRLEKLVQQLALSPDPDVVAITCFFIHPSHRRQGHASRLLREVLRDLRDRGVRRVEAYPKRGNGLDADDLWTGPEPLFLDAGFRVVRDDPQRPILSLDLSASITERTRVE
jgi:GNAT superfamily N-acetyltransferase